MAMQSPSRVDAGGARRGNDPGQPRDDEHQDHHRPDREWITGADLEQLPLHKPAGRKRAQATCKESDAHRLESLDRDLADDGGRRRAKGHAQTNFAGALRHQPGDDTIDSQGRERGLRSAPP